MTNYTSGCSNNYVCFSVHNSLDPITKFQDVGVDCGVCDVTAVASKQWRRNNSAKIRNSADFDNETVATVTQADAAAIVEPGAEGPLAENLRETRRLCQALLVSLHRDFNFLRNNFAQSREVFTFSPTRDKPVCFRHWSRLRPQTHWLDIPREWNVSVLKD